MKVSPELDARWLGRAAWLVAVAVLGLYVAYRAFGGREIHSHDHGVPTCPVELAVKDQPVIAGLYCPGENFEFGVLECHCPTAHAVKSIVEQRLGQGWTADAIRAELVDLYGPGLSGPTTAEAEKP